MKQRATLDEQINTLVSHGVTFDLMDEEKARRFLSNNSYFFKIKSYENNYRKTIDESGGYVYDNLDFGHLGRTLAGGFRTQSTGMVNVLQH